MYISVNVPPCAHWGQRSGYQTILYLWQKTKKETNLLNIKKFYKIALMQN